MKLGRKKINEYNVIRHNVYVIHQRIKEVATYYK